MTPTKIEKLLADATPGRWLVTSSTLLRIAVSHGKGGIILAGVHRFGKNGGATCLGSPEANARLIAAAPDLARLALDQARELAAKDARIAELEKPVEVKALVWRQPADERGYIALCAVGQYAVFDEGSPRWAFSQRGGYTYFYAETFENAKAAAQADYERRIRAALKEQQP